MKDNLGDKHNVINFKLMKKCQLVIYVIDATHKARFSLLVDIFIA